MSSSKRNQAVIGVFVVSAIALMVIGIVVFSSGKLFEQKDKFVMYFEGSVKGLNIGAPVTFRGVKIGNVVDISLRANPDNLKVRIPVVIEVPKGHIAMALTSKSGSRQNAMSRLIESGLRAKMDLQSIITGQLQINLEFVPNEPAVLYGTSREYIEIPTIPTTYQRILAKLEKMPVEDMIKNLSSSLEALKGLLSDPALPKMIGHLSKSSANLEVMTAKLDQKIEPLMVSIQKTVDHADELVLDVDAQVKPLAGRIETVADDIGQLTRSVQPAIDNAEQVFSNLAELTDPNARERSELRMTLKEFSAAARSVRILADYLERHPESLITGKGDSKRR